MGCARRPRSRAPPAGQRSRAISSAPPNSSTVPEALLLRVYELLRPGRAKDREELLAVAAELRAAHGAELNARLVEEAAELYERRGLFRKRY